MPQVGNVVSLGSLRAQIGAIFISLVIRGLERNGLVEIAFGAGQITEEAANAGAVIQKLRLARRERHRLVVGGQRAMMIVAETVQGSGGVAHERILWRRLLRGRGRGERFGAQFQSHQTLGAQQQKLGVRGPLLERLVDLTESHAPLSGLHEAQYVVHGALGLRRLRDRPAIEAAIPGT